MAKPLSSSPTWAKKIPPSDVSLVCQMIRVGLAQCVNGMLPSSVQDDIRARFGLSRAEFSKFRIDNGLKWQPKPKVKQLSHYQLMNQILEHLPLVAVIATPTHATANKGFGRHLKQRVVKGWPDITGVLGISYKNPGRAFFIEVKVGRDEPKPEQIKIADKLEKAGALVVREARSLEDVTNVLEKEKK